MQEQINRRRLILLAALTTATLLAFWWVQPENRVAVNEDVFDVEDLNTVSMVELVTDRSTVRLSFDGGRWRVNERYDADAGMISVLFATLQQAKPKRPVTGILKESLLDELAETGVKVSLYAGEELKKQFYAGGNQAKTQAYFADPATHELYVMAIPGYRVYVSGIFELNENAWRDKFVFKFNWRNFKRLEVKYPQKPAESFNVSMSADYFGINGLAEADTAKLNTFLDDLSLLTVEEYVTEPRLTDSLLKTEPRVDFLVNDVANRAYQLKLFEPGPSQRVLGLIQQDSQVTVFQRRKIQSLLKPKSFFRKK